MRQFDYQRTVIAYHGCDEEVVRKVLLNGVGLEPSENNYDWLGHGIYFWEHGPSRALEWARESKKIKSYGVLGAMVHLGNCFDLLDTRYAAFLAGGFPMFCRHQIERGLPIPQNAPQAHRLDCAVINWTIDYLETKHGLKFHTVRGVFQEGGNVFENSAIKAKSHIQIVVRRTDAILGYFKPVVDNPENLESNFL